MTYSRMTQQCEALDESLELGAPRLQIQTAMEIPLTLPWEALEALQTQQWGTRAARPLQRPWLQPLQAGRRAQTLPLWG